MTSRDGRRPPEPLELAGLLAETLKNGLEGLPVDVQLSAFARRIAAAGFPMKRVAMGMGTLHPQHGALTYLWRPDAEGVRNTPQLRSTLRSDAFRRSPIKFLLETGEPVLRQRLDTGEPLPFPVLEEIRQEGMTEYAAAVVRFGAAATGGDGLEGVFFSCATDDPDGFDGGQLKQVVELLPHLALAIKARLTYEVARTVSQTYLGADAGRRVLTGEIERGSTRAIDAVIWFCDLRGFTTLADTLDQGALIALLNGYLDALAEPVERHGGQILKFMGDGFLATFALAGEDTAAAAHRALQAAHEVRAGFAALNAARRGAGEPALDFGLALHVGEVLYGNIGTERRLDFTVVGPAVNLASRIQDLCRPLGHDVLLSERFGAAVGGAGHSLRPVGMHRLRGVRAPQHLFTLERA